MIAARIRDYGPNFALYRVDVEDAKSANVLEAEGSRKVELPSNWNGVIAVRELSFAGWARGRTGRHALNEENTKEIVVGLLRVHSDGKVDGCKWSLINQAEINREYSQWRAWNI